MRVCLHVWGGGGVVSGYMHVSVSMWVCLWVCLWVVYLAPHPDSHCLGLHRGTNPKPTLFSHQLIHQK